MKHINLIRARSGCIGYKTPTLSFALLLLALLMPASAYANEMFCFRLVFANFYSDFKLVISPRCMMTPLILEPRISSVNGTNESYELNGNGLDGNLLIGTCKASAGGVLLSAQSIGGLTILNISGPTLETGTAIYANSIAPVTPMSCRDLNP